VHEETVGDVACIVLNNRQYCVILDPVDETGKPQLGQKKLVKGDTYFFLQPGERISEENIRNAYILGPEEAVMVRAKESFDDKNRKRKAGDRWLVYGPGEYFPPVEVNVLQRRAALLQISPLRIYMFYSVTSLVLFVIFLILLWIGLRFL